jgi:hypothetical protein
LVGATLSLAFACGGQVTSNPPDELQVACNDEAHSRCDKGFACSYPDGGASESLADCIRYAAARCIRGSQIPGVFPKPSDVAACAAKERAMTCDQWFDFNGCVYPGTKTIGQSCVLTYECASGYCDRLSANGQILRCGTCASPALREGDTCTVQCGSIYDYPNPLLCVPQPDGTNQCVRLGEEGEPCGPLVGCDGYLQCGGAGSTGTCVAPTARLGEACDDTSTFCRPGNGECNPASHVCGKPSLAHVGEPCGLMTDGTIVGCGDYGTSCRQYDATRRVGVCTAFIEDGAPCELSTDRVVAANLPLCRFPATCFGPVGATTGTCKIVTEADCRTP